MFQTPAEIAKLAVERGIHVVGASSLAAGHLTLIPELREELDRLGGKEIAIIAGGVIPPQDYDAVRKAGAVEIFPPGTAIPEAAERLADRLLQLAV
jgi:methylmalonyl-CoA mutase